VAYANSTNLPYSKPNGLPHADTQTAVDCIFNTGVQSDSVPYPGSNTITYLHSNPLFEPHS